MPNSFHRNARKRAHAVPKGHEATHMWKGYYFEVNGHKCNPPKQGRIGRYNPLHPMMRLARGTWYLRDH